MNIEREAILQYVLEILDEITSDIDVGILSSESRLGDLGLESISLVYLIAEIQQRYNLQDMLFQKLRTAQIYAPNLLVSDMVDLVCEIFTVQYMNTEGQK